MRCEDCRDAISARLDGEDLPGEAELVDAHVAGCAACVEYADRAARVTRLARTTVAEQTPDLVATVLDAAPPVVPKLTLRRRITGATRVGLIAVGIGQAAIAVSGLVAAGRHAHGGVELVGASATHLVNESSAWNLGIAVAFLLAGTGASRSGGMVSVIAVFLGLLSVLSVPDLLGGRVEPQRLVGHGIALAGLVLLMALRRLTRDGGGGIGHRPADDHVIDGPPQPQWPPLRSLPPADDDLAPTARVA